MTDPKTAAEAVTTPTTFSFAQAVLDRAYPEFDVKVYLDEGKANKLVSLAEEIAKYDARISGGGTGPAVQQLVEKVAALSEEKDAIVSELQSQAYTVHVKGIAPEKIENLQEHVNETFPPSFEESTSPITGAVTKTEVPHPKAERYYATVLRFEHITQITAPDGSVDQIPDVDTMGKIWANLPIIARQKIDQAINDSTLAVDYYREIADEVF